jgi:hypothetical protein
MVMKTLWILTLAVLATSAVVMASRPAVSSQTADCGTTFDIRDPQLRTLFAQQDRSRNSDFSQLCTVYRADLATRRAAAQF